MDFEFTKEFLILEDELKKHDSMVLATSANNRVTARSVSTIYSDGCIYFQTDMNMEKFKQIEINPNVALSVGFLQIEGVAELIGKWASHPNLRDIYMTKHFNSYETYKNLESEIVIKVSLKRIKKWSYIDGKPFEFIYVPEDKKLTCNEYQI